MKNICAECGCKMEPNTPDEEAQDQAEVVQFFAHERPENLVAICDDCWQKVRPDHHPDRYAAYIAESN